MLLCRVGQSFDGGGGVVVIAAVVAANAVTVNSSNSGDCMPIAQPKTLDSNYTVHAVISTHKNTHAQTHTHETKICAHSCAIATLLVPIRLQSNPI